MPGWYRSAADRPAAGTTCGPNRQKRACRVAANLARAGFGRLICVQIRKRGASGPWQSSVSEANTSLVAVIAAVVVSLAVGSVLVLENRAQHAALLEYHHRRRARPGFARIDAAFRVNWRSVSPSASTTQCCCRTAKKSRPSSRISNAMPRCSAWWCATPAATSCTPGAGPATSPAAWRAARVRRCVPACRPCRASRRRKPSAKWKSRSARSNPRPIPPRRAHASTSSTVSQIRQALVMSGALGAVVLLIGFVLAWWAGRRMHQPITTLIRAPTASRRVTTRARSRWAGGVTSSASCSRRSSACARSCARPRSTRTT